MAVTSLLFGNVMLAAFDKEIDFLADTITVQLHTVTYVPNQDTHDYQNDLTNEVVGTGYTTGGATLASKTHTYTSGTNVTAADAANPTWTTSTITARVAVVIDTTPGTSATNPLLCYFLSDADVSTTAGTFEVTFAAAGIFTITAA